MSTRCHIVVKEKAFANTYIYHHCDGYPDGVGSELVEALKVYTGPWNAPSITKLIESIDDQYKVDSDIHGDEDYIYEISCDDRTLKCYNADNYDDQEGYHGDEIVIPGNTDFAASRNANIPYNERCPDEYLETLTRVVCAMMPLAAKGSSAQDLVRWSKNIVDEMFKTIFE